MMVGSGGSPISVDPAAPAEISTQSTQKVQVEFAAEHFSGPLPPASLLAEYERILPGLAERIVAMAEKQQAMAECEQLHAHQWANRRLECNERIHTRGQRFGLIATLSFCAFAAFVAYLGHPKVAALIAGTSMVALAGAFFAERRAQKASRMKGDK